jgi:hypothetical protein
VGEEWLGVFFCFDAGAWSTHYWPCSGLFSYRRTQLHVRFNHLLISLLLSIPSSLRLASPLEIDARARLASLVLVLLDVVGQLLLLRGQLGGRVLALGGLDLQRHDLQLQFEHLVLDLADLQRLALGRVFAPRGLDGVVETPGVDLGRLGRLACRLEDGEVVGVDVGKIVDL